MNQQPRRLPRRKLGTGPYAVRALRPRQRPTLGRRVLESKLTPPARRPGCVTRAGLVNRLRVEYAARVVSVSAPPGYGKTTLVGDWARRDGRRFAWYTIDDADDAYDFVAHLTSSVSSLREGSFAAPAAFDRLDERVTLLARSLEAAEPSVIVLDDVDLLQGDESVRLLALFAGELPSNTQLVLVTWSQPPLGLARLLSQGELAELGVDDLRFTDREARGLLRHAGVDVDEPETEALNAAVEGWPAGLYFAGLSLKSNGADKAWRAGGLMFDYFQDSLLSRFSEEEVRFLTRASVLDRMCGPLCDAVTAMENSSDRLDRLEHSNLFVVPLDRIRHWYRFHSVFRGFLRCELDRREPGMASQLLERAASWCFVFGDPARAFEYAQAADNFDQLVDLLERAMPFVAATRPAKVDRWLTSPDESAVLARHPAGAVIGALTWGMSGRSDAAESWADAAERASTAPPARAEEASAAWQALLHSVTSVGGPAQMLADARRATDILPLESPWRATALVTAGIASALQGDLEDAEAMFAEATETAASLGATAIESMALACQSLLATTAGASLRADALAEAAERAVSDSHLEDHVMSIFTLAAGARRALRHGDWKSVHTDLDRAKELLPRVTHVLGAYAVFARIEFARVLLALGNVADAFRLLDEVEEIFARRPELRGFDAGAHAVRDQLEERSRDARGGLASLTAAELRLLPYLTTHLSFREIADRLYVSRNTVKTQAISVYRKLGVSSRGSAIARASALGLVEVEAGT
jgi:LuxR family transcriptional regulator, maltose regulon positive regulatory protein